MTLQELLLNLSKNKNYTIDCNCVDSICIITIKDFWSHRVEIRQMVNLEHKEIDHESLEKLRPFFV